MLYSFVNNNTTIFIPYLHGFVFSKKYFQITLFAERSRLSNTTSYCTLTSHVITHIFFFKVATTLLAILFVPPSNSFSKSDRTKKNTLYSFSNGSRVKKNFFSLRKHILIIYQCLFFTLNFTLIVLFNLCKKCVALPILRPWDVTFFSVYAEFVTTCSGLQYMFIN